MVDPAVNEIAHWAMPYVVAAVRQFGARVFDKATEAAADDTAGYGRRLLARMLHRSSTDPHAGDPALVEAVEDAVNSPDDAVAAAGLEARLRRVLAADPDLLRWLAEQRGTGHQVSGHRSVAAGDISGSVVITGDGNRIER